MKLKCLIFYILKKVKGAKMEVCVVCYECMWCE